MAGAPRSPAHGRLVQIRTRVGDVLQLVPVRVYEIGPLALALTTAHDAQVTVNRVSPLIVLDDPMHFQLEAGGLEVVPGNVEGQVVAAERRRSLN